MQWQRCFRPGFRSREPPFPRRSAACSVTSTQVFSRVPPKDSTGTFVRTRLTHSLGASSIGCSARHPGWRAGDRPAPAVQRLRVRGFRQHRGRCLPCPRYRQPAICHSGEDAICHWAHTGEYVVNAPGGNAAGQSERGLPVVRGQHEGFSHNHAAAEPDNDGGLQLTPRSPAALPKYPRESWVGGSRSMVSAPRSRASPQRTGALSRQRAAAVG